jgi:hypothetical protein
MVTKVLPLSPPAKYLIGVFSVCQRHPRNRRAWLQSLFERSGTSLHLPSSPLRFSLNERCRTAAEASSNPNPPILFSA